MPVRYLCILVFVIFPMGCGGGGGGSGGLSESLGVVSSSLDFVDLDDVALNETYISNEVQLPKLRVSPQRLFVSGGDYSLNGGPWQPGGGFSEIRSNDRIRVRVVSAATFGTSRSVVVVVNQPPLDWGGAFTVTTPPGQASEAPVALVSSPVDGSVVDTRDLLVTGTADDPDGIQEVLVNGVVASSDDGFNTWEAMIPLATGLNTIVVETADRFLNRNSLAASVEVTNLAVVLEDPDAITIDPINGRMLIVDDGLGAVIETDLTRRVHQVLSPASAGVALQAPVRIAVSPNRNLAWVIDAGYGDLVQIDLASGQRSLLTGQGDALAEARDLAIDEVRNRLYVMRSRLFSNSELDDTQIYVIDMLTGERAVLSDNETPTSDLPFTFTMSIVFDSAADRLLALQRNGNAILAIDPTTGERSILADESGGVGEANSSVIDEIESRILVASRPSGNIYSVDMVSLRSEILWRVGESPIQIALDRVNDELVVLDNYSEELRTINLTTGTLSSPY